MVDNDTTWEIESVIKQALARFEPRALVKKVITNLKSDANSIGITVEFQVVNFEEIITVETTITRLR